VDEIRLIVMPYELGRLRDGVGRGPERLLESGAEDALAGRGATVRKQVLELEEEEDPVEDDVDASFRLIRMISAKVGEAVHDGALPVVLSGSCFAAVGVVAGLHEPSPGVVWFDAHGDFNNPETGIFGYFDGMGLAVLTGSAWQGLLGTVEGATPVPETAVVLAGARALDEPERPRLESSGIVHLRPESLESPESLLNAVGELTPSPTGLYVHVDLDVLDKAEAHVNTYSAPDGLSSTQLESLVGSLLERTPVRAISLTAYDPQCDTDGAVPPIARRLLGAVAEHAARTGS
jgi:arginase